MVNTSDPTEIYPITSLADYVRRVRNQKNLSLSQVSAKSHGRIGKTHINRIENGTVARVSLTKLRALARGLDVSEDELIAVAQGKSAGRDTPDIEQKLLTYFRQLSSDRKEDLLLTLRALVERRR